MKYLLDTNICIYIIRKREPKIFERLRTEQIDSIALSSITIAEMEYGICKSNNQIRNRIGYMEFIMPFSILSFDDKAAAVYGQIRADLERKGTIIGGVDLLIGAHAKSLGLTLVTNNEREFQRIDGLKIENWTK